MQNPCIFNIPGIFITLSNIYTMLRHIKSPGILDIFRTLYNPCIYNHAIFRTLAHLESKASLKSSQTYKMIRHIQSPDIVSEWGRPPMLFFES